MATINDDIPVASPSANISANRTSLSLIARAREQDPEAWERLVKLYAPLVYFWCRGSGLADSDLNDIFQEVFQRLAQNINKFHPIENGTFRGWLKTMTRNKLNDHFRKQRNTIRATGGTDALHFLEQIPVGANRESVVNRSDVALGEEIQTEKMLQNSLLCQALSSIRGHFSSQTWKAFWMVVVDGRETGDVAKDLGMRPGTVRVAKSRVLKRLRLEIGDAIE